MDSALEVDLDFEHNVRPPPVITEEVTASLEETIKKRIVEVKFSEFGYIYWQNFVLIILFDFFLLDYLL